MNLQPKDIILEQYDDEFYYEGDSVEFVSSENENIIVFADFTIRQTVLSRQVATYLQPGEIKTSPLEFSFGDIDVFDWDQDRKLDYNRIEIEKAIKKAIRI